mmetsp:Transcript_23162/g.34739  ORF Transcript_23162/g.34739 Transcript_23162/m.34739 type:complete len:90 (+) Transcript_23162:635-904(+)
MARSRRPAPRTSRVWDARWARFASPKPTAAVATATMAPIPGDRLVIGTGGCCAKDDRGISTRCAWVPVELGRKAGLIESTKSAPMANTT